MKRLMLVVLLLASVPSIADSAQTGRFRCGGFHFVRTSFSGTELGGTAISFINLNDSDPVTIDRITVKNFFGQVIHESTAGSHPTNTDFPPFPVPPSSEGVNISTVPPGASYYLTTRQIFGAVAVPGAPGGGNNLSIIVDFSTNGRPELVIIGGSVRVRRLLGESEGEELSRTSVGCVSLK